MTAETVISLTPEQYRLAGRRLRELRRERGWSQDAIGRKAGLCQATVSLAEGCRNRNGQVPSLSSVLALASALGAGLDDLLAECGRCHGEPPAGFCCLSCGAS